MAETAEEREERLFNESLGIFPSLQDRLGLLAAPEKPEKPKVSASTLKAKNPLGSPGHMQEMLRRWKFLNDTHKAYQSRLDLVAQEYERVTGSKAGVENTPEYKRNKELIDDNAALRNRFMMRHPGLRHFDEEFSVAVAELYHNKPSYGGRGPSKIARRQRIPWKQDPNKDILYDRGQWAKQDGAGWLDGKGFFDMHERVDEELIGEAIFPDMTTAEARWRGEMAGIKPISSKVKENQTKDSSTTD